MKSKSNPLPFLVLLAAILWCGLFVIKQVERYPKHAEQYLSKPQLAKLGKIPIPPFPKPERSQVAIIIDDFGYSLEVFNSLHQFCLPVTISILPNHPASRKTADLARAAGYEIMLHLPMISKEGVGLEKDTLSLQMSPVEIRQQIEKDLVSVGPVSGVNNHMGSLATTDTKLMEVICAEIKDHNLFFIDSVTSSQSVAFRVAKNMGLSAGRRSVFLDNEKDPKYIKSQIRELINKAEKEGRAIGIGHANPTTFAAIKEMLPEIENAGISLVPVSRLLGGY